MSQGEIRGVRIVLRGAIREGEYPPLERDVEALAEFLRKQTAQWSRQTHPEWWQVVEAKVVT